MRTIYLAFFFTVSNFLNAQCFQSVSTADGHSIALTNEGTIWSWGKNESGELGVNSFAPSHNIPLKIGNENDWAKVFAQSERTFVIKNNGTLWACGSGFSFALGNGNNDDKHFLVQIGNDNDWSYVASGAGTMAIKTNGTLWGWGANIYGMLNLGATSIEMNPVQISSATDWVKVVIGGHYALALKSNGTLWACGENNRGQLGDGTTTDRVNFVQVGTDSNWTDIASAKYDNSMGVKADGTLWGWGANRIIIPWVSSSDFLFSNTLPDNFLIPTQLGIVNNCSKVTAEYKSYLVLKNDGTIWKSINGSGIAQFGTESTWNFLEMSYEALFATKNDSSLWVQGWNGEGQLGLGNNINYETFTQLNCAPFLGTKKMFDFNEIQVFPNPVKTVLNIKNKSVKKINKIMLHDIQGKVILEVNNNDDKIDLSELKMGIYILNLTIDAINYQYKVIKK